MQRHATTQIELLSKFDDHCLMSIKLVEKLKFDAKKNATRTITNVEKLLQDVNVCFFCLDFAQSYINRFARFSTKYTNIIKVHLLFFLEITI